MTEVVWPDWPSNRRPKRWRFAPVWHAAVRSNRLLRTERQAHKATRQELATANALVAHRDAELLDRDQKIRRLENAMDFLVAGRIQRMESDL